MPPSPSSPRNRRHEAEHAGRRGEALAALYLTCKLYRIVARRAKTPVGEIDIIAQRGRTTVFVEVKTRRFVHNEAEAHGAVNRRRIVRAAQFWLGRHPPRADDTQRFDVIFLAPFALPRHLKSAFDASGL